MNNPAELMQFLSEQLGPLAQLLNNPFAQPGAPGAPAMPGGPAGAGAPGNPAGPTAQARRVGGAPPLEIYMTADEVVVCAILPGLAAKEHVAISLEGPRELTVEAFLQPASLLDGWLRRERFSGPCHRTVTLPVSVAADAAHTRYIDGVLEIRLRRLEPGPVGGAIPVLRTE